MRTKLEITKMLESEQSLKQLLYLSPWIWKYVDDERENLNKEIEAKKKNKKEIKK